MRSEPVCERQAAVVLLRDGRFGERVAESPAREWDRVDEGFAAGVRGGVVGVEGGADEVDLFFGNEDGVGEVAVV